MSCSLTNIYLEENTMMTVQREIISANGCYAIKIWRSVCAVVCVNQRLGGSYATGKALRGKHTSGRCQTHEALRERSAQTQAYVWSQRCVSNKTALHPRVRSHTAIHGLFVFAGNTPPCRVIFKWLQKLVSLNILFFHATTKEKKRCFQIIMHYERDRNRWRYLLESKNSFHVPNSSTK